MRNVGLDEAQAGIKTAGRNINNFRYADDTTLMAESKEELKSLLMKLKEEIEKVYLQLNIQKFKIMSSGPITSCQIDGGTVETVADFTFFKRFFCSSSLSAIKVVSSAYLKLLMFLPEIFTPVCASSNLAFHMMDSAYKLSKHGDNTQP